MAAHNNIKNIQFIIGKPEDALMQAWSNILQAEEVILIIDPPSNSKPRFYIDMIGDMNNLTKVIYLNSNSKSNIVKNLMSLTEAALLPVRVVPVDIAPHTVRLEMVVLCKKFDAYQISRPLGPCDPASLMEGKIQNRIINFICCKVKPYHILCGYHSITQCLFCNHLPCWESNLGSLVCKPSVIRVTRAWRLTTI
ncbi:uncharacterized protein LOC113467744 [Diaphorina citri]|uniref:Uncharacterized protein LOC113467744 n=1 Tax=Diaphorina citri TaxID=121845 RepID=A0A3Q0IUG7_DIACI|nr:uncharacterized protein LOC113467744 [Diaphorina citri]